jgi:serine/threonine-protein kinase
MAHTRPRVLSSGSAVLFHVFNGSERENQVELYDFDTGERHNLFPGSSPQFVASGHLVYWREGSLWAVPFDPDSLEVKGEPVPIEDNVFANPEGWSPYAVADNGLLVYRSAGDDQRGHEERWSGWTAKGTRSRCLFPCAPTGRFVSHPTGSV